MTDKLLLYPEINTITTHDLTQEWLKISEEAKEELLEKIESFLEEASFDNTAGALIDMEYMERVVDEFKKYFTIVRKDNIEQTKLTLYQMIKKGH